MHAHAHSTPRNVDNQLNIKKCFTEGDLGTFTYEPITPPSTINEEDASISDYVDQFLKRTSSYKKVVI